MPDDALLALSGACAPWQITDDALEALARHLLRPGPERGAALLGPRGSRLVHRVLPDRPGGRATYRHSRRLQRDLDGALRAHPGLGYRGTAHSHPGTLAEPSDQDLVAFSAVHAANPALGGELLFPIAVRTGRALVAPVLARWGQAHLIELDGGCLAGYTLRGPGGDNEPSEYGRHSEHGRDGGGPTVATVAIGVLPVGSFLRSVCAVGGSTFHDAGVVREPSSGLAWLRYRVGRHESWTEVLFAPTFPWTAPLIGQCDGPLHGPPWDLDRPLEDRARILGELISSSPPMASGGRR